MDDAFELSVLDSGDPARIIAMARSASDLAIEPLPCLMLKQMIAFREQLAVAARGRGQKPTDQALNQFGEQLFRLAFQANVLKIYHNLPATHSRLQILSNRSEIQSLPWEYLHEPGTIPGPNSLRSVVRVVPTIGVASPKADRKLDELRLLYVYADPIDQDHVDWEEIKRSIEREFGSRHPQRVTMKVLEGASPQTLYDALNDTDYDVLHFAGHGQVGAGGVGELLFRNFRTGDSQPLSATQLGILLRGRDLRLVVLSSCDTATGDFTKEFSVVAKTLVEAGVPAVVANQFPVSNSIAAKFAKAFYAELLRSGDVDLATTQGRVFLALEPPLPGAVARFEWGIPTLYRHIAAAKLWLV